MAEKVKDNICGMTVDKTDENKVEHKGKTYYLCGMCRTTFSMAPDKDEFLKQAKAQEN